MSAVRSLTAVADWRSWAVFRRNALVFLRNWRTAVIPPAMEPVIFFLAFGIGLSFLRILFAGPIAASIHHFLLATLKAQRKKSAEGSNALKVLSLSKIIWSIEPTDAAIELHSHFTVADLRDALVTPQQIKSAGFSLAEFKHAGFYLAECRDAGFSVAECKDAAARRPKVLLLP